MSKEEAAVSGEKRIARERATVTDFGGHLEPVLRVEPGERFMVETQDNFFGAIHSEDVLPTPDQLDFLRANPWRVNPVAGPIRVEGLKAGDALVVELEDLVPSERGWTGFIPTFGNLAGQHAYPDLQRAYSRVTRHRPGPGGTTSDGTGTFHVTRPVEYPLRPFLGTIVTAPERGIENTLVSQGTWGGNIDCKHVCRGHRVIMNTYHDGGLLFFGDGHAAQGDSEYTGIADESAMDTTLRCEIIERTRIPGVLRIETPTSLIQVDSARNAGSMDRALNGAFTGMMEWLTADHGMDTTEAYLHFTVNPDVVIHTYQFVGPSFYVVGVEFLKKYL